MPPKSQMARLNDVPAPTESVDALKRRFIRQNREIARANSTQSLRIRGLESETSRLLAENITLRQQVNKLETGAHRDDSRHFLIQLETVKSRLDEKVREIGELVEDLGTLQSEAVLEMAGSQQKKSASRRSSLAEDQKRRKSGMVMLSDAVRNQEGRLPAIVEGKVYPRQSLEMLDAAVPDYIDAVDHSDSPDIGPPPVAHFDHVDNLDFEHNVAEEGEDRPAEEEVAPTLPRFEGRKKRRESANVFDFKRGAQAGEENTPSAETDTDFSGKMRTASVKPLRTAAKRKMSVREDEKMETWCAIEEPVQADNVPEDENNEGTAEVPPSPEQDDPARTIEEGQKPKRTTTRSRTPDQTRIPAPQENDESPERPALVPKSTNLDPVSPRKQSKKKKGLQKEYVEETTTTIINKDQDEAILLPTFKQLRTRDRRATTTATTKLPEDKSQPVEGTKYEQPTTTATKRKDAPSSQSRRSSSSKQDAPVAVMNGSGNDYNEFPDPPPPTTIATRSSTPHLLETNGDDVSQQHQRQQSTPHREPSVDPTTKTAPGSATSTATATGTAEQGSTRPSRRPRAGTISYAEPNLRAKMRRPSKNFVSAVAGEGRLHLQSLSSSQQQHQQQQQGNRRASTQVIDEGIPFLDGGGEGRGRSMTPSFVISAGAAGAGAATLPPVTGREQEDNDGDENVVVKTEDNEKEDAHERFQSRDRKIGGDGGPVSSIENDAFSVVGGRGGGGGGGGGRGGGKGEKPTNTENDAAGVIKEGQSQGQGKVVATKRSSSSQGTIAALVAGSGGAARNRASRISSYVQQAQGQGQAQGHADRERGKKAVAGGG